MVMVKPRIQFSTKTRTAKKGATLKIQIPDEPISVSCSSSKVTFDLDLIEGDFFNMKSKFLKKLCVYAISASMVLPASAPVLAATTTSVVRDYRT